MSILSINFIIHDYFQKEKKRKETRSEIYFSRGRRDNFAESSTIFRNLLADPKGKNLAKKRRRRRSERACGGKPLEIRIGSVTFFRDRRYRSVQSASPNCQRILTLYTTIFQLLLFKVLSSRVFKIKGREIKILVLRRLI